MPTCLFARTRADPVIVQRLGLAASLFPTVHLYLVIDDPQSGRKVE
jgi:hypothetical protein